MLLATYDDTYIGTLGTGNLQNCGNITGNKIFEKYKYVEYHMNLLYKGGGIIAYNNVKKRKKIRFYDCSAQTLYSYLDISHISDRVFGMVYSNQVSGKLYFSRGSELYWVQWGSHLTENLMASSTSKFKNLAINFSATTDSYLTMCSQSVFAYYDLVADTFHSFNFEASKINLETDQDLCLYFPTSKKLFHLCRDTATVYQVNFGLNKMTSLFRKRRFWFRRFVDGFVIPTTESFFIYSRHAQYFVQLSDLAITHSYEVEWDNADHGTYNYVMQMGYGIAQFDAANNSVGAIRSIPEIWKMRVWDANPNTPILIIKGSKDVGGVWQYLYASDTETQILTTIFVNSG